MPEARKKTNGNVIAEADGTTGVAAKEYIWLPGAGYAGTDLPVGVVDVAGTATPELLYVHADHLGRPIRLTDPAKVTAWAVEWLPWGGVHTISGSETLNARFPGQWFQVESGLHYNWHRHYDPTIGRYTQPDPLGFVDGPSVYAYARNAPTEFVDPTGEYFWVPHLARWVLGKLVKDAIKKSLPAQDPTSEPAPVPTQPGSDPSKPDTQCRNGCKPCRTVSGRAVGIGTRCYRYNPGSRGHYPHADGEHVHIYEANQAPPPNCRCFWSAVKPKSARTLSAPPAGMMACEKFAN